MANRRSGSSWSLFGEGEVYSEDVDPFKAIYGVRKEEFKGIYQTKGMACSVYVKKDEKQVAHFVTWSGVTRDLLNKPAQVNRFSSQHFRKYTAPVGSNSTVETFGHFSFLPAGPIFASLSWKKFIVAFKPLEQEEDLEAYYFVGSEKLTLKLDTKTHKLVTFSEEDRQKLELSPSSVLGAPIIVKNKSISPRNSGRWCVVGVVGLSREGELCPHFVTNEIFGLSGPSDAVQPPISQTPENSTNPPGGEAVDASGLSGPSDAVQPPISQTPENPTNPPGGEAVDASGEQEASVHCSYEARINDDSRGQPGPSDAVQPPISQTPENSTNPPGGEAVEASGMDSKTKRRRKEETASGMSGDEISLRAAADKFLKILISAPSLEEEQQEEVYKLLAQSIQNFEKFRENSSDNLSALVAFIKLLESAYQASLVSVGVGSLEVTVDCQTLKGLEHLWNDYLSGHLNSVAEQYLVTDEMKQKLGLEAISLKTTIEEENYLICKKALLETPGEADHACLSSQEGVLHQGSGASGMDTSADYNVVKEQDASWAIRMEKAKVSRSALHRVSISGQYEEVNRHLKNGANVDERDQFLLTPLHLACWYGHESVVKLLLDHNADVNALDRFQFTPLQKAERCNHQSIIQLLLDHDAKPSFQQPLSLKTFAKRAFLRADSHSGFNVLQAIVLQGDYDSVDKASTLLENFVEEMKCKTMSNNTSIFSGESAVDILLAHNCRKPGHADVEKLYQRLVEIDETLSELHLCAKSGDVEKVIELVLNDGMDVNVAAKSDITPLLLASRMSSGVLIKTLIDLGADVNAETAPGKEGPLLYAASSNNYMVVRLLLEHGADSSVQDNEGNAPLLSSVNQGFFNISRLIVNAGIHPKLRSKEGETPLNVSVKQDNKADANIQDCWGEAPLHKAVMSKNVPLVKLLLENNADANIQDLRKETPLHQVVSLKDVPHVTLLLEEKADANIKDQQKEGPLRKAVTQKDVLLVKLLLENKADVNIQDQRGETPLHKAVTLGDAPLVKLLLENKAGVNIQDCIGQTPIHKAVTQKDISLVKLLLEMKADVNIQDCLELTPLLEAVMQTNVSLVKLLLEMKADVNIQDCIGQTPIHEAVTQKDVPLVKLLLEMKADVNIQDCIGQTPIHKAVTQKDVPLVELLLEMKADVNIQDWWGEAPLHKAVTQNDILLVKLLLENKANANVQDQSGNMPLHLCALYGCSDISQLLTESGCNVNRRNNKGETPRDIESSERWWSKSPSAAYSQQAESLISHWIFLPVRQTDLLLPQIARVPYCSEQSLDKGVQKAGEKWPIRGVVMKEQQELLSGEEESQAQVT